MSVIRKFSLIFACAILYAIPVHGLDWVFQWYAPTILGFSSGRGAVFHQFRDQVDDRWLQPFEAKFLVAELGPVALSASGILSYYMENDEFGSLNTSLGVGISPRQKSRSSLQGFYFTLYPMYEFPAITAGKTSFFSWKAAMDIGYGFNFLSRTDIYIGVYIRLIGFWKDSFYSFGAIPDFGLTLGWHFQDRMFIDEYLGR